MLDRHRFDIALSHWAASRLPVHFQRGLPRTTGNLYLHQTSKVTCLLREREPSLKQVYRNPTVQPVTFDDSSAKTEWGMIAPSTEATTADGRTHRVAAQGHGHALRRAGQGRAGQGRAGQGRTNHLLAFVTHVSSTSCTCLHHGRLLSSYNCELLPFPVLNFRQTSGRAGGSPASNF